VVQAVRRRAVALDVGLHLAFVGACGLLLIYPRALGSVLDLLGPTGILALLGAAALIPVALGARKESNHRVALYLDIVAGGVPAASILRLVLGAPRAFSLAEAIASAAFLGGLSVLSFIASASIEYRVHGRWRLSNILYRPPS
jgi:hypothetical protein